MRRGSLPPQPVTSILPSCPTKMTPSSGSRLRSSSSNSSGGLGDMGIHNLAPVFSALKLGAPESVQASSTPVFEETVPLAAMVHYQFPARGQMPGQVALV